MVAATLTPTEVSRNLWDVIVIGAGPAGALAARQLARSGLRILLVDRNAFPRSKVCGGCLNLAALAVLNGVGMGPVVAQLEGVPIREFQLRCGSRGLTLPLPGGMAVSRRRLDATLVEAAVVEGAEFLPETRASLGDTVGGSAEESREVTFLGAKSAFDARTRIVIAADGLGHSSLNRHGEFVSRVDPSARIGLGGELPEADPWYRPGTITMAVGRGGYVGLTRIEEERLTIAAALDAEFVRSKGTPAAACASLLDEAHLPLPGPLDTTTWQGTLPLTRHSRRCAGRRVLLAGDAAGYVEPFTGEGMAWALAAGAQVESFVQRGLAEWNAQLERTWTVQMRRMTSSRQRWCRLLTALLRFPRVSRAIMTIVAAAPRLAKPVIRALNAAPPLVPGRLR